MKLYKYVSSERIDVLINATIRFSSPLSLNDPFELKPNITRIASDEKLRNDFDPLITRLIIEEYAKRINTISLAETLDIINKSKQTLKQQFPKFIQDSTPEIKYAFHRALARAIGILCLSESPNNLLMWAHYADSHRGFVIEFEATSDFFDRTNGHTDDYRHLHKVLYTQKMPQLSIETMKEYDPFVHKSIDWRYEQEWRMLLPLSTADAILGTGPTAIHLFKFPKSCITGILFGSLTPQQQEKSIINVISNDENYQHVKLYKSAIDSQDYKLNILPIS